MAVASLTAMSALGGPFALFEDAIQELEKGIPAHTTLTIPQSPIVCVTPLKADADDRLHPVTKEWPR